MAKDYYKTLGVAKDADDKGIKSAYKKAAMKHHPDRNPDDVEGASKRFKEVSEAFEVLSDSNKRAIYDQFGEEGLKGGGPPPPSSGSTSGFGAGFPGAAGGGFPQGATFSFGGMPGGMGGMGGGRGGFSPSDPNDIFSQFFSSGSMGGGSNPFASYGGGGGGGRQPFSMDTDSDDASPFGGMGGMGGMPKRKATEPPTVTEIIRPLPVSLEDLYTGATKKLKVTKKRRTGEEEANTLEIAIKPGYKAGTRIKFKGAGHETATTTQDMVFVLEEKPHPTFKREGDDLVLTVKVPLVEALTGPQPPATGTRSIKMLDGRNINYSIPFPKSSGGTPIKPGQVIKVLNEGMPISRKDSAKKKGDLLVKVEVVFPTTITASQAEGIRKVLG